MPRGCHGIANDDHAVNHQGLDDRKQGGFLAAGGIPRRGKRRPDLVFHFFTHADEIIEHALEFGLPWYRNKPGIRQ